MAREPTDPNALMKDISTGTPQHSSSYMPGFLPLPSNTPALPSQRTQHLSPRPATSTIPSTRSPAPRAQDKSDTMRRTTTMADIPLPITYTPTTHRISKAKKGKRVHACEFPGCNKVFTRAEHRRRHELNHNPEASFPCTHEGCRKAFHRPDLLARHMERHELDAQSDTPVSRHWRQQPSKSSITSAPSGLVSQMPVDTNPGAYSASSQPPTSMSTGSIVGGVQPDLAGDLSVNWNGMEIPLQPRAPVFVGHMRDSDDLPFYSSPETCASPSSDGTSFPIPGSRHSSAPTAMMERYASNVFHTDLTASPLQLPVSTREWEPLDAVATPSMVPLSLDSRNILNPVGEPSCGSQPLELGTNVRQEPPVPVSLSNLDGDEWFPLRRELASAPGIISGSDGMEIVDIVKWQDCLECYWLHFHPFFPIVHRPTFPTKPSPLMAGAMIAIGSQYDTRPNSKEYSLVLLEACLKLLPKSPAITSRSRVTDIQTVFLLEVLSKFRSRRADVQISHRFRSLYGSFIHDRHWVSLNPLAVLNTLPSNPSSEALAKAQKFWVEHEARRRVLQAAFILDAQQLALFAQPPVLLQPSADWSSSWERNQKAIDIPFPCSSDLWESKHLSDWFNLASAYKPTSLSAVADTFGRSTGVRPDSLDTFQSTLLLAHSLSSRRQGQEFENSLRQFGDILERAVAIENRQPMTQLLTRSQSPQSRTLFTYHAFLAAHYSPLHALLTVSGESWLFNKKLPDEEDFRTAKSRLRAWASDTDDVRKAVWHAVRVLQYAAAEYPGDRAPEHGSATISQQMELESVFGITKADYGPLGGWLPSDSTSMITWDGFLPGPVVSSEPGPLTMLHANWSLYICALICWAYGFEHTAAMFPQLPSFLTQHRRPDNNTDAARSYVSSMLSLAPTWEHISHASIPVTVRSNTLALLKFIRLNTLQGRLGGLLNEGERVLARLEERKGQGEIRGMWNF